VTELIIINKYVDSDRAFVHLDPALHSDQVSAEGVKHEKIAIRCLPHGRSVRIAAVIKRLSQVGEHIRSDGTEPSRFQP